VRVSTGEQVLGAEAQRRQIEEFCRQRGIELDKIFEDIGVSGSVPASKRRGFKQMIEYCLKNNIRLIIVYSLDRLGRSFFDIVQTLIDLEFRKQIRVITIREVFLQILDLPIRLLVLMVLSWVAYYERKLIRERTRAALAAKGVKHSVELDEETEDKIVHMYLSGLSIKNIACILNISERQVRKVLYERGILQLPEDTCPRCFGKMIPDEHYENCLYCPNCGFIKPTSKFVSNLTNFSIFATLPQMFQLSYTWNRTEPFNPS